MPEYTMIFSEKLLFGIWILLGFCVATVYKCNLRAMLTTQQLQVPFKTVDDLIANKDYRISMQLGSYLFNSAKVIK